jgi:hypothetical protein
MLPDAVGREVFRQIARVRERPGRDLLQGGGWVAMPRALARKMPGAGRGPAWQYLFPATCGERAAAKASPPRERGAKGGDGGGPSGDSRQARDLPHVSPLLRDPPPGRRLRHPHDPGAARTKERPDHQDLDPRSEPQSRRRDQPPGPTSERTAPRGTAEGGTIADTPPPFPRALGTPRALQRWPRIAQGPHLARQAGSQARCAGRAAIENALSCSSGIDL